MKVQFPGAEIEDLDVLVEFVKEIHGTRQNTLEFLRAIWYLSRQRAWEQAALEMPDIIAAELNRQANQQTEIISIEAVIIER